MGAPAQGAQVVDLLGSRVGILAELDFGQRQQARQSQAHRAADDGIFV
jgi:hypothetical protein